MLASSSAPSHSSRIVPDLSGDVMIVRAAVAPLHGEPRVSSSQVSQALGGQPLRVIDRQGDWLRVRGRDDYEGWVHPGYLGGVDELLGPAGAAWYANAPRSLGCRTRGPGGERDLPLGALLLPLEECVGGDVAAAAELERRFPPLPQAIVDSALRHFRGTSYQWGGVTPWGADCSGLVQAVFGLHGVAMPRDAWQQAEMGEAVDPDPTRLRAADLLFFSDREDDRITHVAIALGDGGSRMLHLALGRGGYSVERLDESTAAADPYVARLRGSVRAARRLPFAG